jgi:heat shock protein HslJ
MIAACLTSLLACQQPESKNTPKDSAAMALASAPAPQAPPDSTVLQGSWTLQPVLASDTAAGKRATLQFDLKKSRFTGNTGCNNMSGKFWFSASDSSLTFSEKLVTTKMACTGYNEKAFLKNLLLTTHYTIKNGVLIFLADDKTELSRWERKPSPVPTTGKA